MDRTASVRPAKRRQRLAAWLLVLFSLAQAVPVVALAATEGMSGMTCCKHGSDSCCRRKSMHKAPSFLAGHPCGMPCAGTPTVPLSGHAVLAAPSPSSFAWPVASRAEGAVTAPARSASGYDASRFQRPPPVTQL